MAVAALIISILALVAAGASAYYTRKYAETTTGQLEAQKGAHSDALTPKVTAVYIPGRRDKPGKLRLTSHEDSPTVTTFRCTLVASPSWVLGFRTSGEAAAEVDAGPLQPRKPLDLSMHQAPDGDDRRQLIVRIQTTINGAAVDFETGCIAARFNASVHRPLS